MTNKPAAEAVTKLLSDPAFAGKSRQATLKIAIDKLNGTERASTTAAAATPKAAPKAARSNDGE